MKQKPSKMLTVSEVAGILRVHPNTLRGWSDQGLIRTYHFGPRGDRRFQIEDVYEFIASSQSDAQGRKDGGESPKGSRQDYKVLFDNTFDAVLVIDAKTKEVLLANETAARISGFDSADEMIGILALDFLSPEDKEIAVTIGAEDRLQENLGKKYEFRGIMKNGVEIWVEILGTIIEYHGRMAALVSLRDTTERQAATGNSHRPNTPQ